MGPAPAADSEGGRCRHDSGALSESGSLSGNSFPVKPFQSTGRGLVMAPDIDL